MRLIRRFDQTVAVGRGVIVYAQPDDLKSQPVGAAEARSACGVIGIAKL